MCCLRRETRWFANVPGVNDGDSYASHQGFLRIIIALISLCYEFNTRRIKSSYREKQWWPGVNLNQHWIGNDH